MNFSHTHSVNINDKQKDILYLIIFYLNLFFWYKFIFFIFYYIPINSSNFFIISLMLLSNVSGFEPDFEATGFGC